VQVENDAQGCEGVFFVVGAEHGVGDIHEFSRVRPKGFVVGHAVQNVEDNASELVGGAVAERRRCALQEHRLSGTTLGHSFNAGRMSKSIQ